MGGNPRTIKDFSEDWPEDFSEDWPKDFSEDWPDRPCLNLHPLETLGSKTQARIEAAQPPPIGSRHLGRNLRRCSKILHENIAQDFFQSFAGHTLHHPLPQMGILAHFAPHVDINPFRGFAITPPCFSTQ